MMIFGLVLSKRILAEQARGGSWQNKQEACLAEGAEWKAQRQSIARLLTFNAAQFS